MNDKLNTKWKFKSLVIKNIKLKLQVEIALEGLTAIKDSNDPMNIAAKTIEAMTDCD